MTFNEVPFIPCCWKIDGKHIIINSSTAGGLPMPSCQYCSQVSIVYANKSNVKLVLFSGSL